MAVCFLSRAPVLCLYANPKQYDELEQIVENGKGLGNVPVVDSLGQQNLQGGQTLSVACSTSPVILVQSTPVCGPCGSDCLRLVHVHGCMYTAGSLPAQFSPSHRSQGSTALCAWGNGWCIVAVHAFQAHLHFSLLSCGQRKQTHWSWGRGSP